MARRQRGGVALSVFLPGAPQLLAGRFAEGLCALVPWVGAIVLLATRAEIVASQLGEGTPGGRAAFVVLTAAGLSWAWSLRDVGLEEHRRPVGPLARLVRDPWAGAGLATLLFFGGMALAGPPLLLPPGAARTLQAHAVNLPPSAEHLMGVDQTAADVFERYLSGARTTLGIGLLAGIGGALLGIAIGAWAGYRGRWVDSVLMRVTDFFIALPKLVLLIALAALYRLGPVSLAFFIALVQWPSLARIVRGDVMAVSRREFVHALRSLGVGDRQVLLRHVLPNIQGTILVGLAIAVANALLIEAGLAFLGLGLQEQSWGGLIRDGRTLFPHWWIGGFAGLSLVLVVVALNLVADAVRDVFDPRADVTT